MMTGIYDMKLRILCLMVVFYGCLCTPEKAEAQLEIGGMACISSVTGFSIAAPSTVIACNPVYIAASIPVCVLAVGGTTTMAAGAGIACYSYYVEAHNQGGGGFDFNGPGSDFTQNDCVRVSLTSITGTSCANSDPVCQQTTTYYHVLDPTGFCL